MFISNSLFIIYIYHRFVLRINLIYLETEMKDFPCVNWKYY